MRVLGIDPGSRFTGFGIIEQHDTKSWHYVTSGHIKVSGEALADKLKVIYEGISSIILNYKPTQASIEQVFMHKNANSALKLGHARGAAMVAVANYGIDISEYAPRQIKQAVSGYGGADKTQIQTMVTQLLKLDATPQSDAADALAIALCHAHHIKFGILL